MYYILVNGIHIKFSFQKLLISQPEILLSHSWPVWLSCLHGIYIYILMLTAVRCYHWWWSAGCRENEQILSTCSQWEWTVCTKYIKWWTPHNIFLTCTECWSITLPFPLYSRWPYYRYKFEVVTLLTLPLEWAVKSPNHIFNEKNFTKSLAETCLRAGLKTTLRRFSALRDMNFGARRRRRRKKLCRNWKKHRSVMTMIAVMMPHTKDQCQFYHDNFFD